MWILANQSADPVFGTFNLDKLVESDGPSCNRLPISTKLNITLEATGLVSAEFLSFDHSNSAMAVGWKRGSGRDNNFPKISADLDFPESKLHATTECRQRFVKDHENPGRDKFGRKASIFLDFVSGFGVRFVEQSTVGRRLANVSWPQW